MSTQIDVAVGSGALLIVLEEAVTFNSISAVVVPNTGEPTDAEAWQLAEAFRDSDYVANRTENAVTINSVSAMRTINVEEPS